VIPSYKDPLLQKTIDSIIDNAVGDFEIIAVLDGYYPTEYDWSDKRIRIIHLGKNVGMRGAINIEIRLARGEYIMRTDEHCSFAKGFDKAITDNMEDNWIVTPTRYFLDPIRWKRMNIPPVNFCKLVNNGKKFSAESWKEMDNKMENVLIGETMGMQGSCWFMKKSWWEKVIGELQTEGYGHLIQDSHEMIFKTWKAGGKMMLNKGTWHAHKHRDFKRTHNNGTPENPAHCDAGYKYAIEVWGDYYEKVIRPRWGI